MDYVDTFTLLKNVFTQEPDAIPIPCSPVSMVNCSFSSCGRSVLPGAGKYTCEKHGTGFTESADAGRELFPQPMGLSIHDVSFGSNSTFRYTTFVPSGATQAGRVIILLHGLNERYWHKYLPWAMRLAEHTGSAVVLFPIAFHMNRAPDDWSRPKAMKSVAAERQGQFASIAASTFANAAISSRLQAIPQRFFWSGMQTYSDILQLVRMIRQGTHPLFAAGAHVDFFAYSIGSFLAQIVLMADEEQLFSESRLFIFCGGPTFDRMYPVSKYIMDSEALIALYAFFVEHLENEFKRDARLAHYFGQHPAGLYFQAMLSHRKMKDVREQRLRAIARRVASLALSSDTVIQPAEVLNTLQGDFRDIPIPVEIMDFPFPYTHVSPFPLLQEARNEVSRCFDSVFERAATFLQ